MEIAGSLGLYVQTRHRTLMSFDLWKPRVCECMLLWKPRVAKVVRSGLERHLTDYVQVHTCVFHYLIALGDWCLSWQIYLLKAKLFGWQDYRMPEGERDQMLREKKRERVMCRKHGEAIKPAGKSRLKCGSNLFYWAQVDSHAEVKTWSSLISVWI